MSKPIVLILKKEFFNQILSGEKKEEFRSFSDFYINRFCTLDNEGLISGFKDFDTVVFALGYGKNRPEITVKVDNIHLEIDWMDESEDAEVKDGQFRIELGEIVDKKNV